MTTTTANLIVYPVSDLAAAKSVYTALLGTEPYVDQPYYVGYRVGDQELGLDPNGAAQGSTAPLPYYDVADIEAAVAGLTAAGAQQEGEIRDVGGGKLIARLRDADGNAFAVTQAPAA